jgi:hypothetical protein
MLTDSKMLKAKSSACLVKCSQHAASLLTYKKIQITKLTKLTEDSVIKKYLAL